MTETIIVACDPGSVSLKDSIVSHLLQRGFTVEDVGSKVGEEVPYYQAGYQAGQAVSQGRGRWGIVLCGSGMGVNLVANLFPGVFCAVCESVYTAQLSRAVNDANMLALGANLIAAPLANKMVDAFLDTRFLLDFPEGDAAFLSDAVEIIRGYKKELC